MSEGNRIYPQSFYFGGETFSIIQDEDEDEEQKGEYNLRQVFYYSNKYSAVYNPNKNCINIIENGNSQKRDEHLQNINVRESLNSLVGILSQKSFSLEFFIRNGGGYFTTLEVRGIGTLYKLHNENKYIEPNGIFELIVDQQKNSATLNSAIDNVSIEIAFPIETKVHQKVFYFKTKEGGYINFRGDKIMLVEQEQKPNPKIQEGAANNIVRFKRNDGSKDDEGSLGLA